jgi:hypothetical protein
VMQSTSTTPAIGSHEEARMHRPKSRSKKRLTESSEEPRLKMRCPEDGLVEKRARKGKAVHATVDRDLDQDFVALGAKVKASRIGIQHMAVANETVEDVQQIDQKRLDRIEQMIMELNQERTSLIGGRTPSTSREGPWIHRSPRESSKGQKTKVINPALLKNVKNSNQGTRQNSGGSLSIDSCGTASVGKSGNFLFSDPQSQGLWVPPKDAPPYETNSNGRPIGHFWDHLRNYAFERGRQTFDASVAWNRQESEELRLFKMRLRCMYPGTWDEEFVMSKVRQNLKERRQRIRKNFKHYKNKEYVTVPHGLTLASWNNIHSSLIDPKYFEKSEKCKAAAIDRTRKIKFPHRLGPAGVPGFLAEFVRFSYFLLLFSEEY